MDPVNQPPQSHHLSEEPSGISGLLHRRESDGPWDPAIDGSFRAKSPKSVPALHSNVGYSEFLPGQAKALDGIALRAFLLGNALACTGLLSFILICIGHPSWRVPFFVAALAVFHFLEYYVTAAHNTRHANISAFLLSQNGVAYNVAHSLALFECLTASFFFPSWQSRLSNKYVLAFGLAMVVIGQTTRSLAMAQAGTNFNHTVQSKKNEGHQLVTRGIYAWSRHPSYFGFFWWAIGTQAVLGNGFCFIAYTLVLWRFFSSRIQKEEEFLLTFFGGDYQAYKLKTGVGIPFIR